VRLERILWRGRSRRERRERRRRSIRRRSIGAMVGVAAAVQAAVIVIRQRGMEDEGENRRGG
jgi:hypothetical protein